MSLILSYTNKSHDSEAIRELSISRECVEFTCEIYSLFLQVAEELEKLDLQLLSRIVKNAEPKRLLGPRTLWKFFARPSEEMTVTSLREKKDWTAVSRRTVERYLERLRDLHIISSLPTKGEWGKPGSRPKVSVGRFPTMYKLNPLFAGNLLTSDAIDTDTRKLLLVCQKLLLGMAEFRDCFSRITTWLFKIGSQSQSLLEAVQRIPELNVLQKGRGAKEPSKPPEMIDSFLLDEIIGTAIFKMNYSIDSEDLPWEEIRRHILA